MILNILKKVLLGAGRNNLENEVKPLRSFIDADALIPWSDEEVQLLSLQLEHKTKKSFFNRVVSGSFKTIYAETVISYAYKNVHTGTKRGLILAKSKNYEYVYRLRQGVAEVYIDGNMVGIIDYQGRLKSIRSKKVLAMVEQSAGNTQEIIVGGIRIGSLNKPTRDAVLHQRAVQLFKATNNKGMQLLVSLVIFEVLKRNV